MTKRRRTAAAALAAVTAMTLASPTFAADRDLWFEVSLGGSSMGHMHEVLTVGDDGMLTTSLTSDMAMMRGDELVSVKGTDVWVESPDGTPVSYMHTRKLAMETIELDVTAEPGRLRLRKSDGRDAVFTTIEFEGELLFPAGIERLHVDKGFVEGSEYTFQAFDTDFEEVAVFNVRVEGRETLTILGESRELMKLVLTSDLYEGIEFIEWRSADGELWRDEAPQLDSARERSTGDLAMREKEAEELLAVTSIPSNVAISDPRTVDDALFELWVEGGDISESLPEDVRQSVEGTTNRGVLLRVSRVVPSGPSTVKFPVRDTSMKDYTDGNALMQTWYPRILGTAVKQIWGTNNDPWDGAVNVEKWVYNYIEDKGLGTAFASAQEVLENMSGDCTEHAILMATMARAVGIPTRLAAGIVHYEGDFAYHMWVEVWNGEAWYALDPTVGRGSVDATHIKLADSAVRGGRVAELSVGIMRVFNRLGVKVIEYTVDGETVRVSG